MSPETPAALPAGTDPPGPAGQGSVCNHRPDLHQQLLDAVQCAIIATDPDMLAADGHAVDIAGNGAIALEKLGERSYDLILSDMRMPELDGPGLYRELGRPDPELTRRVLFLTGDTLGPEITEFLERTGARSLNKPFALEEARRVVQQALRVVTP